MDQENKMLALTFCLLTTWNIEVVATGGTLFQPNNIAIDSSGNPYILVIKHRAYIPFTVYYLFLYSKNNGDWVADTFELNADEPFPVNGDLTIDRYDRVWCVYSARDSAHGIDYLIVARKDSLGWAKDTVTSRSPFYCQSIATDSLGVPHIAYDSLRSGYPLGFYAVLNDSIWQKEVFDSNAVYYSIDLDSQNQPHISYYHGGYNLWYAKKISSVWYCEEVDHTNYPSWWITSICIGPDDLPGIAYTDPHTGQLKYAYSDGGFWNIDTVEPSGSIGYQKSLDIDSLGQPYFIYARSYNSWLAYKTASGWQNELLPLTPTVTKGSIGALRIGRDGTIHIVRIAGNNDWSYREIHYIYGTPVGIEEESQVTISESQIFDLEVYPNPFSNRIDIRWKIEARPASQSEAGDDRYKNVGQGSLDPLRIVMGSLAKSKPEGLPYICIYDVSGKMVKQFDCPTIKLFDQITWDGDDDSGRPVSAGVYFVRLEIQGRNTTKKIIKSR